MGNAVWCHMRRDLTLALVLLSFPLSAEEQHSGGLLDGARAFFGASVQLVRSFGDTSSIGGPPLAVALQVLADSGEWMVGGELRVGFVRSPSLLFIDSSVRVDRYLLSGGNSFYAGGSFGYLNESDFELYGGAGAYAAVQAGYLWGRARRWGRAAVELQLTLPLFGERANKPGNYVYPFVSLGVRLFL
jgi:hypothetical protein